MNKNKVLDTALSIIDKYICLDNKEIVKKIYTETGYRDQDYNKFLSIVSSGKLTLCDYIRKRRLYFAVCDLMNHPEKSLVDITQDYGYSEQSAFTRAVKKEYSKTPAELRKSKLEIPDNRKMIEGYFSKKSRLDSVMDRITSDGVYNWHDDSYFESFIHATEEFGFDVATCCLISELSEKLDIPFAFLMKSCFEMAIKYHSTPDYIPSHIDYVIDIGITSDKELYAICKYFDCEYYDLTDWHVQEYREKQNRNSD